MNVIHIKNSFFPCPSKFLRYFFAFLCLLAAPAFSDDLTDSQAQLDAVNKALTQLQVDLKATQKETNVQRQALTEVESELGKIQKTLSQLDSNIKKRELQSSLLGEQKAELKQRLESKEEEINSILRLAYKQNNQPLIKLLLSDERPEDLSRHLYYFSILTRNQQVQVETWLLEQAQLSKTIVLEKQTLATLRAEKEQYRVQKLELTRQKKKRAQVVANLEADSRDTTAEIARRKEEREKIAELIKELKSRLDNMSLDFPDAVAIESVKGKLNWPVEGRLANRYGRRIDASGLTWEGWLFNTSDGQPVKAVHGGRVVFADFFKSNGLLMIIDHGNGVWTLYGRNQALLRDVGSWVEAGDVIAKVGRSGGYKQSGLYFEVRKNGEPQNPASWLRKR